MEEDGGRSRQCRQKTSCEEAVLAVVDPVARAVRDGKGEAGQAEACWSC